MSGNNGEDYIDRSPGMTEMAIGTGDGKVHIRFKEPRELISMDPANAAQIGNHLINCAVELGLVVTIVGQRKEITPEQHAALCARANIIIQSQRYKGRKSEQIAVNVVDEILNQVT